jgi:hypothetical protein
MPLQLQRETDSRVLRGSVRLKIAAPGKYGFYTMVEHGN